MNQRLKERARICSTHYILSVERDWWSFGAHAPFIEVIPLGVKARLPIHLVTKIVSLRDLIFAARPLFSKAEDWLAFQWAVCDAFCDEFALHRSGPSNPFYPDYPINLAVEEIARGAKGFLGVSGWSARASSARPHD